MTDNYQLSGTFSCPREQFPSSTGSFGVASVNSASNFRQQLCLKRKLPRQLFGFEVVASELLRHRPSPDMELGSQMRACWRDGFEVDVSCKDHVEALLQAR